MIPHSSRPPTRPTIGGPIVDVSELTREYVSATSAFRRQRKRVIALEAVSFSIGKGEIFGLLGPNGAGKTTLTRILATILLPTSGRALIDGYDVTSQASEVRRRIGIALGGERGLYQRLSGSANMEYQAALYGVPGHVARPRIARLLDQFGLSQRASERVENYSRGMKQRLHLARALVHDPPILLLDEPTIGLDPTAAREIRRLIVDLSGDGKTVLLTTHYLYEADEICSQVAILRRGSILLSGSPSVLKAAVRDAQLLEIEILEDATDRIERIRNVPGVNEAVVQRRDETNVLLIYALDISRVIAEILACLVGVQLGRVASRSPSLEDAYLSLLDTNDFQT
jgi:ABC-2 type transport system ATP-binding protein